MRILKLTLFILIILISSCNENEGCTDANALNFNALASKDDGSCLFCTYDSIPMGDTILIFGDYWQIPDSNANQWLNVFKLDLSKFKETYEGEVCVGTSCLIRLSVENYMDSTIFVNALEFYDETIGITVKVNSEQFNPFEVKHFKFRTENNCEDTLLLTEVHLFSKLDMQVLR